MERSGRRSFLGYAAAGAGGLIATHADAAEARDGHAAGMDVAPAESSMPLVPRRAGDAPSFTISLDRSAIKATSGGWAREITTRQLPIATGLAAAHLFLNPGGSREMHWHNSAEWAYVIGGQAQATVVTPEDRTEVFNVGPGDVWYFPRGYPHAIQTIGAESCHALLIFDDGAYSEHGTFGITDVLSRLDAAVLAKTFCVPAAAFDHLPQGERISRRERSSPRTARRRRRSGCWSRLIRTGSVCSHRRQRFRCRAAAFESHRQPSFRLHQR